MWRKQHFLEGLVCEHLVCIQEVAKREFAKIPWWSDGEKPAILSTGNSEACRKPKYWSKEAAHNMRWNRRWRFKGSKGCSLPSWWQKEMHCAWTETYDHHVDWARPWIYPQVWQLERIFPAIPRSMELDMCTKKNSEWKTRGKIFLCYAWLLHAKNFLSLWCCIMCRIFLYFARSCILSCLSKIWH